MVTPIGERIYCDMEIGMTPDKILKAYGDTEEVRSAIEFYQDTCETVEEYKVKWGLETVDNPEQKEE